MRVQQSLGLPPMLWSPFYADIVDRRHTDSECSDLGSYSESADANSTKYSAKSKKCRGGQLGNGGKV